MLRSQSEARIKLNVQEPSNLSSRVLLLLAWGGMTKFKEKRSPPQVTFAGQSLKTGVQVK